MTLVTLGLMIRVFVIILGIVAGICLWVAKTRRRADWTRKMTDIWFCHFLYVDVTVTANIELLFRRVEPTYSMGLIIFILIWTIQSSLSKHKYLKKDEVQT